MTDEQKPPTGGKPTLTPAPTPMNRRARRAGAAVARRKPGRPLTFWPPELCEKILGLVRAGVPPRAAALACGVPPSSWHAMQANPSPPAWFLEFSDEVERAKASAIARNVVDLEKLIAETKDRAGRQWLLGKLAPEVFGDRNRVEMSGPDGKPIQNEHAGPGGVPLGVVVLPPIEEPSERPEGVVAGAQVRVDAPAPPSADVEAPASEPSSPAPPPRAISVAAPLPTSPAKPPTEEPKPETRPPSFADLPVRPGRAESIGDLIRRSHQDDVRGRGSW